MDAGGYADCKTDWYYATLVPPDQWLSLVAEKGWVGGIEKCFQLPLVSFPSVQLPAPPLVEGSNYVCFALISQSEGSQASGLDFVQVKVQGE